MPNKVYNRVIETSSNTPSGASPQSISLSGTSPALTFVGAGTSAGRKFVDKYANGETCRAHIYQTNSPNLWVIADVSFATGSPNTLSLASANIIDGNAGAATLPTWTASVTCVVELGSDDLQALLDLANALFRKEASITGAVTATLNQAHVCSGTSADYTVTLPTPTAGGRIGFRMATGGALTTLVTLDAGAGVTIDGKSTTLSAAITTTFGTSISVTSASGFPGSGKFVIQIDSEQMLVTAGVPSTTLTVVRGINGTTAATHSNGAAVDWNRTRLMWEGEAALLLSDGSNWFKVAGKSRPMQALATTATGVSCADSTSTKINVTGIQVDNTNAMIDTGINHRVNIKRDGVYSLRMGGVWLAFPQSQGYIESFQNGANVGLLGSAMPGTAGAFPRVMTFGDYFAVAGDYFEMYAVQYTTSTQTFDGSLFTLTEVPQW